MERGDIAICVLSGDCDKPRPAVIVQSDLFNETHNSIVVCPITSHLIEAPLFRIDIIPSKFNGLTTNSQIMVDKIIAISRNKIKKIVGTLDKINQEKLEEAVKLLLELD